MTQDRRSGRGPAKGGGSARSGREQPAGSAKAASARRAPGDSGRGGGGGAGESAKERAKQQVKLVMFLGSGFLVLVIIVLLIVRGGDLFGSNPPPPKPQKIFEDAKLEEVDDLAKKAAKQFGDAKRITDVKARNAAIRQALDTAGTALDKLDALSSDPKYQGEDYDGVFEPKINRLQLEIKTYREALRLDE